MKSELLDRFEAGVSRLLEEIQSTRERLKQAEAEADGLRIHTADRDRLEARVAELEEALAAASNGNPELEARVAELTAAAEQKDARIAELEGWHADTVRHRDEVQAELEAARARTMEVEGWLRDTTAHRDQVQEELKKAAAEVEDLRRERDDAVGQAGQADALHKEAEDLRQRLAASVDRENQTRRRLDALIKRIEETESILDSVEIAQHGHA